MLNEIRVPAFAKVNLGLKVLPVRQDGFHNLESIFQTVSLCDELTVVRKDGKGICSVSCDSMVLPEKNTLTTAYKSFCDVTGIDSFSVEVKLEKHIPAGGGLGGGSSDAASLIMALEKMHGIKLTGKQLDAMASCVGSDVFFFAHCGKDGGCAVVTGRGENVRMISKRTDLFFVLVFPPVHSSTKEAYSLVDKLLNDGKEGEYPALEKLEDIYNLPVSDWSFRNTFTPALELKYPEVSRALKSLEAAKPLYSEMSGSGSTIFGIYASLREAEEAAKILNDEGLKCVVTQ